MGEWAVPQDVRQAIRTLRRQPAFTAAAIVMLALGIGATVAIFSVVKSVLLDPLPYPNSGALVRIVHNSAESSRRISTTPSLPPTPSTHRRSSRLASGFVC